MFDYPYITMEDIRPGIFRIDHADYHNGPGVSSSTLKAILRSPAHTKTEMGDSPALAFGRAFHMAILEPELYRVSYAVKPKGLRSGTKKHTEWMAENEGKESISEDDQEKINRMAENVKNTKTWQKFKDYPAEIAHFAMHEPTGLLLKCKCDMIGDVIVDWKSTSNASPKSFFSDMAKYQYPLSAALYQDIVLETTGRKMMFVIGAVEKTPPFGVAFYELMDDSLEQGRKDYKEALSIYGQCVAEDKWPCYPDEIQPAKLPRWYFGS